MNSTAAVTMIRPGPRNARLRWLSWGFVAIYIGWIAAGRVLAAHILPVSAIGFTEQLLLTAFFVTHALQYYCGREVVFFAVTNIVISNVLENISIITGVPFGFYHHNVSPKLFHVPYIVTLIYLSLGYISWMMAQVLLRRLGYGSWRRLVYVAPMIAAFVFTCWDLCIDPIYGTIYRAFVYRDPGVWFGTPAGNYFGWLITTYAFYLPFALYLRRQVKRAEHDRQEPGRSYWLQPVLLYLAIAVGVILANLGGAHVDVTLDNGKVWNSGDIYGASTLVTIFTMVFLSLLALVNLHQASDSAAGGH